MQKVCWSALLCSLLCKRFFKPVKSPLFCKPSENLLSELYNPLQTVFNGICRSALVTLVTYSKYLIICHFHVPTRKRKSGTQRSKEKKNRKKKWLGAPSRSIKYYGHVPRVEICNEITTSFQIYKKVSTTTPYILFYLPNGGKLSKMLLLKSI